MMIISPDVAEELPPITPQEQYAILPQRAHIWLFVAASVFGILAAVFWDSIPSPRLLSLESSEHQGPSRGAIMAAADARTNYRWLAKAFRLAEVFCNTVVPMRMMLAVNPWAWQPALALAYLVPNFLLTGFRLPQQPIAIMAASARQRLNKGGSHTKKLDRVGSHIKKFNGGSSLNRMATLPGRVSWAAPGRGARAPGSSWR